MPKLTKRVVEGLELRSNNYIVFDAELPGFGIRVMPSGKRFFLVQYRKHGRTRRVMLGQFGPLTAEIARRQGQLLLARARSSGPDPATERGLVTAIDNRLDTRRPLPQGACGGPLQTDNRTRIPPLRGTVHQSVFRQTASSDGDGRRGVRVAWLLIPHSLPGKPHTRGAVEDDETCGDLGSTGPPLESLRGNRTISRT